MSKLRFSQSVWMSGAKRGTIGIDVINDELQVAYLDPNGENEAIHMAQLEWVPCMRSLSCGWRVIGFGNHVPFKKYCLRGQKKHTCWFMIHTLPNIYPTTLKYKNIISFFVSCPMASFEVIV